MNKDYALLAAIKKFGTIHGKKAFHKINYFANLKTDLFMYEWRNWGPFSSEIQQFYEDACLENTILVSPKTLANSATQYNICLDQNGEKTLESLSNDKKVDRNAIDDAIDFAHELLNGKTPRQMEILASVHYVHSYDDSMVPEKIWKIINRLKPAANFTQTDVEWALSELKKRKMI